MGRIHDRGTESTLVHVFADEGRIILKPDGELVYRAAG